MIFLWEKVNKAIFIIFIFFREKEKLLIIFYFFMIVKNITPSNIPNVFFLAISWHWKELKLNKIVLCLKVHINKRIKFLYNIHWNFKINILSKKKNILC